MRSGTTTEEGGSVERSAAALFTVVWNSLAEILGAAATAAIVRRATKRAAVVSPQLVGLIIIRADFEYCPMLPQTWSQNGEDSLVVLRALALEIGHLLLEMTGTVVISRLEQIPELAAGGLVWRVEEAN